MSSHVGRVWGFTPYKESLHGRLSTAKISMTGQAKDSRSEGVVGFQKGRHNERRRLWRFLMNLDVRKCHGIVKTTEMITEHNILDTNMTSYALFIYTPFYFYFSIPFLQPRLSLLLIPPSRNRFCKPPSHLLSSLHRNWTSHRPWLHPSLQIRQQPPVLTPSYANPFWPTTVHRLRISLCSLFSANLSLICRSLFWISLSLQLDL